MTQSDSQILINQTRWFQVCTFLLFTIGSMAVYDYVQEKKINREQQIQISENSRNIAVQNSKQRTTDSRLNQIERVVFIK